MIHGSTNANMKYFSILIVRVLFRRCVFKINKNENTHQGVQYVKVSAFKGAFFILIVVISPSPSLFQHRWAPILPFLAIQCTLSLIIALHWQISNTGRCLISTQFLQRSKLVLVRPLQFIDPLITRLSSALPSLSCEVVAIMPPPHLSAKYFPPQPLYSAHT